MNAVSVDLDALERLPAKTFLRYVQRKQEITRWLEEWSRTIQDFPPLFLFLEGMDIEPRFNGDDGSVHLSFSGNGEKFGRVWGELRRAGFRCDERPKAGATQFAGYFMRDGYARLWLFFTSSVCRQVQVGTRTVEQPIYETRCGENLPEVEDASAPALTSEPLGTPEESGIPF